MVLLLKHSESSQVSKPEKMGEEGEGGWNISSDPLLLKKLEACWFHNAVTTKSVKVTIMKISEFFYLKNTLLEKPQLNIINLRLIHP